MRLFQYSYPLGNDYLQFSLQNYKKNCVYQKKNVPLRDILYVYKQKNI